MGRTATLTIVALIASACAAETDPTPTTIGTTNPATTIGTTVPATTVPATPGLTFPEAPAVPDGPLDPATTAALDKVWSGLATGVQIDDVLALGATGDARIAWLLADLLRFSGFAEIGEASLQVLRELTGVTFAAGIPWVTVTDHLLGWDLPEPPGYLDYKRTLFTLIEPRWEPFFTPPSDIDYRWLSWGGVLVDDRPLGDTNPCSLSCIPALDFPAVTDARGGAWYPDDRFVFGVVVGGEARAYPRNIMEVHEMVNDELGGRRFGLPYCTLCGSAQLFFTDNLVGEPPVLRTSGLLSRSNKVMFDLNTYSAFDTFTGRAVTGPLREAGISLEQGTVVTATWGAWKEAHPETTIVAEDGGIGRFYGLDPLGGRDDQGPIFPIGERDFRLAAQEQVVGVVTDDGVSIAFPAESAAARLEAGGRVELAGVRLLLDGDGLRAEFGGTAVASHQAFWFAWSQFHPDTLLWEE
ncbi:MAG: DUF3179 domain-containing protein [Acidimicrobiia bacterium]|nr:DUF3179 domain-containing protein [Acidimicrobiia bacterium]